MAASDPLTCPKRYYLFPSAEGAGQHCESGARTLFHSRAFDWLGEVLNPGGQEASAGCHRSSEVTKGRLAMLLSAR